MAGPAHPFRRLMAALSGTLTVGLLAVGGGGTAVAAAALHPAVEGNFAFVTPSQAPPTEAQCFTLNADTGGRRCFAPDAIRNSYNLGPLYGDGFDGTGYTIALVDSFGSVNIRSDLKVFNDSFGLPHMCGEDGVTCQPGMPTFSILQMGAVSPVPTGQHGTGQEDHSLWALEVNLDVEWAHAIAPGANILLVTTPTAETLGVQGFPQFMMAEDYVVKHNLADVISQSFGSAEEAFSTPTSLLKLRYAFTDAQAAGITVLASSGDNGSAGFLKTPVGQGGTLLPDPSVGWPGSDPLVTSVGGTYLCTDPYTGTTVDNTDPPTTCQNQTQREIGWIAAGGGYSHVFSRPSFQDTLPPGSTPIPASQRGVPDVGYQASSRTGVLVYISEPTYPGATCPDGNPCSPGWYVVGGTSSGSPQWAGLVAIADQINGGRLGFIDPALYAIANNPVQYANDYYDVTTGNNGLFAPDVPGYDATTGWDPVTGVGTPNAANLLPDLAAAA
jgi:subtilase family serine protease